MESKGAELKLKNDYIQELLEDYKKTVSFSKKEEQEYLENTKTQKHGEYVLTAFAMDLVENSVTAGQPLDLTYDTVKNIPQALSACYQSYAKDKNLHQNCANAVAKCFAAYLMLLGMNEHDCKLTVQQMGTALMPPPEEEQPLWAYIFRIKAGTRKETDLLKPVTESIKQLSFTNKGILTFRTEPIIRAYKSAFRTDLGEYGMKNIAFEI